MDEARRVLEWQNVIIAFCFSSAIDITILFAQPKSELSPLYCVLSFAILTTFLSLFVSKFIVHKFAAASQVLEKAAAIVAATALVLATTIPYSTKLKYATWSLYAVSLLTIVICNFIGEIVKLTRFCTLTGSSVISFLKKYVSFHVRQL